MGNIHSVESFGALDGPGLRYVVFLQGCPLHCLYCHNPDSWGQGEGTRRTAQEVFEDILRYRNFLKSGGVTLSGGEPLLQADFCAELLELCRAAGIHTAIDTAGSIPLSECEKAVRLSNLLLLDIKAADAQLAQRITGMDNSNAFALLDYAEQRFLPVWVRHVVVPDLTLDEKNLTALALRLKDYRCISYVELLPFHKMGEYKWEVLRRPYALKDTREPTQEEMKKAAAIFTRCGLRVR